MEPKKETARLFKVTRCVCKYIGLAPTDCEQCRVGGFERAFLDATKCSLTTHAHTLLDRVKHGGMPLMCGALFLKVTMENI